MSLYPSSFDLNKSLIGMTEPGKFIDPLRIESRDLTSRNIHGHISHEDTIRYTIVITCISAIIFVTIISMYDVLRNIVNSYYTENYFENSNNNMSEDDITRIRISNKNTIISSVIFSLLCILSAIILIPSLLMIVK